MEPGIPFENLHSPSSKAVVSLFFAIFGVCAHKYYIRTNAKKRDTTEYTHKRQKKGYHGFGTVFGVQETHCSYVRKMDFLHAVFGGCDGDTEGIPRDTGGYRGIPLHSPQGSHLFCTAASHRNLRVSDFMHKSSVCGHAFCVYLSKDRHCTAIIPNQKHT